MPDKAKSAAAPKKASSVPSKPFIVLPPKPVAKKAVAPTATATGTPNESKPAHKDKKRAPHRVQHADKQESSAKPFSAKKSPFWWKSVRPLAAADDEPAQHINNKTHKGNKGLKAEKEKEKPLEMLISPDVPWFDQLPASFSNKSLTASASAAKPAVDARLVQEMQDAAQLAYHREVAAYQQSLQRSGESNDAKWLRNVIDAGTWSDKVAALALRVQESPLHNLEALDLLLGIALKKDLRSAFMALEAVKDLLVNNLLPDRPLREFSAYAAALAQHSDSPVLAVPLLCYYEHQLKSRMLQVHAVLQEGLKANVSHFRRQGLELACELLAKKPETESRLLEMVVNKLGDADGRIASKAGELVKATLRALPALKPLVVREVRVFLYRPNTKMTAVFAAVNLLTQVRLDAENNKKNNEKNKNNAFAAKKSELAARRCAHLPVASDRALALQLAECYLSLFEKAAQAKEEGSRLLAALLSGINRVFPVLSDHDKNHASLAPYMDSIFRLVHTATSSATSTQALALLSQMVVASANNERETERDGGEADNALRNRFYATLYNKLLAADTFQHAKNTLFLNLLYKSVKADPDTQRAKAFVKRIAMYSTECAPAMAAGLLFMISEIFDARPELKVMLSQTDCSLSLSQKKKKETKTKRENADSLSEQDSDSDNEDEEKETEREDEVFCGFNVNKRDPQYALGSSSATPALFELCLLRHQFHPSARAFAEALVDAPAQRVSFAGDPLVEFSLVSFLNRFAYKNPKQKNLPAGLAAAAAELPMNEVFAESAFVDETRVAPEKHFFYKFFGERAALRALGKSRDRRKKRSCADSESDGEGERESEDEEDEVDRFADKLADEMMRHDARTRGEGEEPDDDELDALEKDEMDEEEEVEDEESENDDEELVGKKKKKKSHSNSAMDFEDFLQQQQGKKKSKKIEPAEDEDSDDELHFNDAQGEGEGQSDEDDEDIAEPQVYLSDDDEDIALYQEDQDSDEEEEEEEPKKKTKKNSSQAEKEKQSDKKKNKKRGAAEDESDGLDGVFADASLFEDQMEEIVSKLKADGSSLADEKRGKRQGKEKKEKKNNKRRKLR